MAAAIGGSASVLAGGKFRHAAISAAMGRLFNDAASHSEQLLKEKEPSKVEGVVIYRRDIDLTADDKYGHWWIEIDGIESYGWWPKEPVGLADTIFGNVFQVYSTQPRDVVIESIRSFSRSYSGSWSWPVGQNCHTFQEMLLSNANLDIKGVP